MSTKPAVHTSCDSNLSLSVGAASRYEDQPARYEDRVVTVVPRGVLWFGTAQRLDAALLETLAAHPDVESLVVDLGQLGRIDTTGAIVLRSVLDRARAAGLTAQAQRIPPQSERLTRLVLTAPEDPLG